MTLGNLYNRYRPTSLKDIVGQDAIVRVLKNAVLQNRIAPAYMFKGPRGSGKTSMARILCLAHNCENLNGYLSCGECNGCIWALKESVEIDAASNRGINEIEDLLTSLPYYPNHINYKYIIIDEAHQLTSTAINALLKPVEEPLKHITFIFCTTSLGSSTTQTEKAFDVLSSRCQCFYFQHVSPRAMRNKLARICIKEERVVTEDILNEIIAKSSGSMRDAENILESLFALYSGDFPANAFTFLYGDIKNKSVDLFLACSVGTSKEALLIARDIWEAGGTPSEVASYCLGFISDVISIRAGIPIYHSADIITKIKQVADNATPHRLRDIATAFTPLLKSGDTALDLDVAVCEVFLENHQQKEEDVSIVMW